MKHRRTTRTLGTRRGLALPVVILATALIAVALSATFLSVGTERRVTNNYKAQLLAFSLAESGLQKCTTHRTSCGFAGATPTLAYDSARVTLSNGYADVVYERMRVAVGATSGIYLVRSKGVVTRLGAARDPMAQRTVALLATTLSTPFPVPGGVTSLNGFSVNGAAANITGTPPAACLQPGIPGMAVPAAPGYTGPAVTGTPSGIKLLGPTSSSAADSVNLDWAGVLAGTLLPPDVTYPGNPWPSSGWHTIKVNGNLTVNPTMDGNGILIVSGGLTINGSWHWNGVILVGGRIGSNGNTTIEGALITGLNKKLGTVTADTANDFGNGNKTLQYDPCSIATAMAAANASQWTVYRNAWTDAWRSY